MKIILKLFIFLLLATNVSSNSLDSCIAHIKKYEGYRATIYYDDIGYAYIGYGHHLKEGENFTFITEKQATDLLKKDFKRLMVLVKKETGLEGNKLLAMTLFSYNVGIGMFSASSVCRAIKQNKPIDSHILKYGYYYNKKGEAVKSKKLLERREFELWLYKL